MANMLIYWDEVEDGAFPDCCMTCGCEDTDLVPRRLTTPRWIPGPLGYMLQRSMTVELPFCPVHRSRPWVRWGRTDAKAFTDEGVWMQNLSPVFVDEMEAFREEEEDGRRRRRKKSRGKRRGRSRDRDDDEDDDEREPFSEPRRPMARPTSGGGSTALYVILVVFLLPVLLFALCCVGNIFLGGGKFQVQQGGRPPAPVFKRPP